MNPHPIERRNAKQNLGTLLLVASLLSSATALIADESPLPQPRLAAHQGRNLVPNGSFELGTAGWTSLGQKAGIGGDLPVLHGNATTRDQHDGEQSLEIVLGPGKSPVTSYDCLPAETIVQHSPLAANLGWITVEPGKTYTLSAWMKADAADVPARLHAHSAGDPRSHQTEAHENTVTLSTEWKRYSLTFTAPYRSVYVAAGPDLRKAPERPATVWIDAIQLEAGSSATSFAPRAAVEVAVESNRFGNVFHSDEAVSLQVRAANRGTSNATIDLTLRIRDYFDAEIPGLAETMTVPAGKFLVKDLALKLPGPGYYRVRAEVRGAAQETTEFPLALIHRYEHRDGPFGLNHAPPTREMMEQLRNAGITWARNWALDWNEVEKTPGEFTWAESDRQVERVREAGMSNLALAPAFASTKWASELAPDAEIPATWRGARDWAWLASAPKDPQLMMRYLDATVRRYKDRVHVWEFLNEPGTSTALPSPYRGPGLGYDAQSYLDLLKQASRTVRAADPKAKLIGGFGLEVLFRAAPFIRGGGLELIDLMNIHTYGFFEDKPENFIPQMKQLLELMDASPSGRKPIWVTESGYFAEDDKPWLPWTPPPGHFSATVGMKSEKVAADHTTRLAIILFAHGAEKVFYHQGPASPPNESLVSLENYFVGALARPQKVYASQAYLSHLLGPDFQFVGEMAKPSELNGIPTDCIYGYAFQSGKRAVLAAWAPTEWQRGRTWSLKIPRDVDAFNAVGTKLSDGGNGKSIILGDSVVYLVTDLMTAADLAQSQLLRVGHRPEDEPASPVTTF